MALSTVFDKFAKSSPVAVMARALMERAMEPKVLDVLFRKHAERQYEAVVRGAIERSGGDPSALVAALSRLCVESHSIRP